MKAIFRPTVHATSRHGTASLTFTPKDDEVSCYRSGLVTHPGFLIYPLKSHKLLRAVEWRRCQSKAWILSGGEYLLPSK